MGNHDTKVGDCIGKSVTNNKQTNSNFINIDKGKIYLKKKNSKEKKRQKDKRKEKKEKKRKKTKERRKKDQRKKEKNQRKTQTKHE